MKHIYIQITMESSSAHIPTLYNMMMYVLLYICIYRIMRPRMNYFGMKLFVGEGGSYAEVK